MKQSVYAHTCLCHDDITMLSSHLHTQGGVQTFFVVVDYDPSDNDDFVDVFAYKVHIPVGRSLSIPRFFDGRFSIGQIWLGFKATCAENFYGENCTIFCVERDDDELGHYTCDSEGNRVCREGYQDPSNNCTECIPAERCCKLSHPSGILLRLHHSSINCCSSHWWLL